MAALVGLRLLVRPQSSGPPTREYFRVRTGAGAAGTSEPRRASRLREGRAVSDAADTVVRRIGPGWRFRLRGMAVLRFLETGRGRYRIRRIPAARDWLDVLRRHLPNVRPADMRVSLAQGEHWF